MTEPAPSEPILTGHNESLELSSSTGAKYHANPIPLGMTKEDKQAMLDRLESFQPLNTWVNSMMILCSALIFILFIQILTSVAWLFMGNAMLEAQRFGNTDFDAIYSDYSFAYHMELILFIAVVGAYLWILSLLLIQQLRANANTAVISAKASPFSRSEVLKAWLIPGLNLFMPCVVQQRLLHLSQSPVTQDEQTDSAHHESCRSFVHKGTWFWWYSAPIAMSMLFFFSLLPFLSATPLALMGLMSMRLLILLGVICWLSFLMAYLGYLSRLQNRQYHRQNQLIPGSMQNYQGFDLASTPPMNHQQMNPGTPLTYPMKAAAPPLVLPENPEYQFHLMLSAPMNGPFLMSEIYHHLKAGNIHAQVLCRRDHDSEFVAIREVEEFQWIFKRPT